VEYNNDAVVQVIRANVKVIMMQAKVMGGRDNCYSDGCAAAMVMDVRACNK
jgi:hypothetical protein